MSRPPSPTVVRPASAAGPAPPRASAAVGEDPLACAISWITRHHGRDRSPESLLAELPAVDRLDPLLAIRALQEAGFHAGMMERRIGDISSLLLPAVLLLDDGDACILVARHTDGRTYDVVMPGPLDHSCTATESDLSPHYTGSALVATPQVRHQAHAEDAALLADASQHWFWGTLRRFTPYYRSALLAALLSNVLMLATGLTTAIIYDKVIPHQAFVTLWALAIGAGIAIAFDLLARQLRAYLIDMAGRKVDLLVGMRLFRQSLSIRMEQRPQSAGAFAHQVSQIETVRDFFASATLSALSDLPFIVIFVAMTFVIGGPLGWVPLLAIPVLVVVSVLIQGALRRAMTSQMQQQGDLHGLLVEAVDGIEDLKAAGAQGRFLRQYEESSVAATAATLRSRRITAFTTNLSMVAQQIVTLVMLVWGVHLIDAKVITGGVLFGSIMFATRALAPLSQVVSLATRYQGARAAMRNLDRMMTQPTDREAGKRYVSRPDLTGRIALREVSFAYPGDGADEAPTVLSGVNLAFEPGERVAVLGRIGSGKSTVLRLLAGLYQPGEGMVEVDGIDLRQIDPADYRARVGFLAQDPRLFKGTLRDNVLLERAAADPARLGEVARLTGLDRVVATHPRGWDLPVGEAGSLLSGGQRQLVALARCLLTRPRILLMDEPTSSMDAQSEATFLRQLKASAGTCTLVMVTHRPAVLELVDRVVVVDAGRIVMDGPKAKVLAALSGAKPAAAAAATVAVPGRPGAAEAPPSNIHRHPATQPLQRGAAV
jgi:ATP-binding cassette subfamily C protein LapB